MLCCRQQSELAGWTHAITSGEQEEGASYREMLEGGGGGGAARWGAGQVTRLHTDTLVTCFTAHRGHLYYATVRGAVLRTQELGGVAGAEQVLAPDPALGRVHCVGAGGAVLVTGHGEGRAR